MAGRSGRRRGPTERLLASMMSEVECEVQRRLELIEPGW